MPCPIRCQRSRGSASALADDSIGSGVIASLSPKLTREIVAFSGCGLEGPPFSVQLCRELNANGRKLSLAVGNPDCKLILEIAIRRLERRNFGLRDEQFAAVRPQRRREIFRSGSEAVRLPGARCRAPGQAPRYDPGAALPVPVASPVLRHPREAGCRLRQADCATRSRGRPNCDARQLPPRAARARAQSTVALC